MLSTIALSELIEQMLAAGAPMSAVMIAIRAIEAGQREAKAVQGELKQAFEKAFTELKSVTLQKREDDVTRREAVRQRVKKHRENKRSVTLQSRYCNEDAAEIDFGPYIVSSKKESSISEEVKKEEIVALAAEPPKTEKPKRAVLKSTQMPPNWELPEASREFARRRGWDEARIDREFERFKARNLARGEKYKSWPMAWQTWVLSPFQAGVQPPRSSTSNQPRSWRDEQRERTVQAVHEYTRRAFGDDVEAAGDDADLKAAGELPRYHHS